MEMTEIILKKRNGEELSAEEMDFIAISAASGNVPDYQLSAWLMAVYFRGLSRKETSFLTRSMARSGERLNLKSVKAPKVDKHSTGGVGDGVSLVLAPAACACGIAVPMMSGRGLGHTGGTLDKLESIKGFKVGLSSAEIVRQIKTIGVAMFGQTQKLAPSDKKIYSLRDATCTVESLPLIVASILSKKYAEDINALVLDVKFGSGAFLRDFKKSRALACALKETAESLGIKCAAVMSEMEEPLGCVVGNANEMAQSLKILLGEESPSDFMEVLFTLGGQMLSLAGRASSAIEGAEKVRRALKSGAALKKMAEMIKLQKGDVRVLLDPDRYLPKAPFLKVFRAARDGYLAKLDSRIIGYSAVRLGAGRGRAEDEIDFGAGICLEKKVGSYVRRGDAIARLYSSDRSKINNAMKLFETAVVISDKKPGKRKLVREIIK